MKKLTFLVFFVVAFSFFSKAQNNETFVVYDPVSIDLMPVAKKKLEHWSYVVEKKKKTNLVQFKDTDRDKVIFETVNNHEKWYVDNWKHVFSDDGDIMGLAVVNIKGAFLHVFQYNGKKYKEINTIEFPSSVTEVRSIIFNETDKNLYLSFDNYAAKIACTPESVPHEIKLPFEKSYFESISANGNYFNMKYVSGIDENEENTYALRTDNLQQVSIGSINNYMGIKSSNSLNKYAVSGIEIYFSDNTGDWVAFSEDGKYYFEGKDVKKHFGIKDATNNIITFLDENSESFGPILRKEKLSSRAKTDWYTEVLGLTNNANPKLIKAAYTILSWEKPLSYNDMHWFLQAYSHPLVNMGYDSLKVYISGMSVLDLDALETSRFSDMTKALTTALNNSKKWGENEESFKQFYNTNHQGIEALIKMTSSRAEGSFKNKSPFEKGTMALEYDKVTGSNHAEHYFTQAFNAEQNALNAAMLGKAYLEYDNYNTAREWFNKSQTALANYPLPVWGNCMALTSEFINDKKARSDASAQEIIAISNKFLNMDLMGEFHNEVEQVNECKMIAKVYLTNKMALDMFLNYNRQNGYNKAKSLDKIYTFLEKSADKELKYLMGQRICYELYPLTTKLIQDGEDPNSKPYHNMVIDYLNKAVDFGLANDMDYWQLVLHYEDLNDSQNAYIVLNKGLKKYPKSDRLFTIKGKYETKKIEELVLNGDYDQAFAETTKLLNAGKDKEFTNDAYFYFALAYYATKEYSNAVIYGTIFSFNDNNILLMDYFPNFNELLNFAKNPTGEAPKIINRTNELKPYFNKFNAYIQEANSKKRGKYDIAKDMNKLIEELKTVGAKSLIAMIHNGLGDVMYGYTSYEDAIECLIPGYITPYLNYFRVTFDKTDDYGKEQVIKIAKENFPNNNEINDEIYIYYYNTGVTFLNKKTNDDYKEGIEFLEKALTIKETAEAYLSLGLCHYGLSLDIYSGPTDNDFADAFAKKAAEPLRTNARRNFNKAINLDPSVKNGKWSEVIQDVLSW